MGERADDLARRIAATTDAVSAAVESGQVEGDAARMLAHHLATSHALVLSLAQGVINGEPFPSISWEMIHEINAQHVRANTTVGAAEALELLRTTTASTVDAIRALTDEQLEATARWGQVAERSVSAHAIIERYMIEHAEDHLADVPPVA